MTMLPPLCLRMPGMGEICPKGSVVSGCRSSAEENIAFVNGKKMSGFGRSLFMCPEPPVTFCCCHTYVSGRGQAVKSTRCFLNPSLSFFFCFVLVGHHSRPWARVSRVSFPLRLPVPHTLLRHLPRCSAVSPFQSVTATCLIIAETKTLTLSF